MKLSGFFEVTTNQFTFGFWTLELHIYIKKKLPLSAYFWNMKYELQWWWFHWPGHRIAMKFFDTIHSIIMLYSIYTFIPRNTMYFKKYQKNLYCNSVSEFKWLICGWHKVIVYIQTIFLMRINKHYYEYSNARVGMSVC